MVTESTRQIAKILEDIGRQKIKLAEVVSKKKLSEEEKDKLYAAAIRDQLGFVFEQCPSITFHEIYLALQMEEMYSDENVYYAGISLHLDRKPTNEEIRDHYLNCGRPNKFRLLFKQLDP